MNAIIEAITIPLMWLLLLILTANILTHVVNIEKTVADTNERVLVIEQRISGINNNLTAIGIHYDVRPKKDK